MDLVEAFGRHSGLLKEGSKERIENFKIVVIGCGAIGGWLMSLLLKMGAENVAFYDDDVVSVENFSNQPYNENDIGIKKIICLQGMYEESKTETSKFTFHDARITSENAPDAEIIVCAVDEIEVREEMFNHYRWKESAKIFIDPRIGLSIANVMAFDLENETECLYYETQMLFKKEEAEDIPCTQKTFISACIYCNTFITSAIWAFGDQEFDRFPYRAYVDLRFHKYDITRRQVVWGLKYELG